MIIFLSLQFGIVVVVGGDGVVGVYSSCCIIYSVVYCCLEVVVYILYITHSVCLAPPFVFTVLALCCVNNILCSLCFLYVLSLSRCGETD